MNETLAERIKKMREARGWPQEQLATVAGVNVRTIQRIESGGLASIETRNALAAAFKVDLAELHPRTEENQQPKRPAPAERLKILSRVRSGADLLGLIGGSQASLFHNDELTNEAEVETVAEFFQTARDLGDCLADMEAGDRVRTGFSLKEQIKRLEEIGLHLFAMTEPRSLKLATGPFSMNVLTLYLTRPSNPTIVRDGEKEMLPVMMGAVTLG